MDEVAVRQLKTMLKITPPHDDQLFSVVMLAFINLEIVTQQQLADELLQALPTIDRWKRGRNLPMISIRRAVHKYLNDKLEKMSRQ